MPVGGVQTVKSGCNFGFYRVSRILADCPDEEGAAEFPMLD